MPGHSPPTGLVVPRIPLADRLERLARAAIARDRRHSIATFATSAPPHVSFSIPLSTFLFTTILPARGYSLPRIITTRERILSYQLRNSCVSNSTLLTLLG